MEAASSGQWEIGGVEPLPITRNERIRERINTWSIAPFLVAFVMALAALYAVSSFVPLNVGETRFGGIHSWIILAITMAAPVGVPVQYAFFRYVGARQVRVVVAGPVVAIRRGQRWRLELLRGPTFDARYIPSADTVSAVMASNKVIDWVDYTIMAMHGVFAVVAALVLGVVLQVSAAVWATMLYLGLYLFSLAICFGALLLIDALMTGGDERPSLRAQREAISRVRAELTEGGRPGSLAVTQVPPLLQPDREGVPFLKHTASWRMAAYLLAAQCLTDAARYEEATHILQHALRDRKRANNSDYAPALRGLLAIVMLCDGGNVVEARHLNERSGLWSGDAYERYAFSALHNHRRGLHRLAVQDAEKAMRSMKRAIYPGQALATEALLRRTLGLPDALQREPVTGEDGSR